MSRPRERQEVLVPISVYMYLYMTGAHQGILNNAKGRLPSSSSLSVGEGR